MQVDVEEGAASPALEGKQKKLNFKLPLSSRIHEVIRQGRLSPMFEA